MWWFWLKHRCNKHERELGLLKMRPNPNTQNEYVEQWREQLRLDARQPCSPSRPNAPTQVPWEEQPRPFKDRISAVPLPARAPEKHPTKEHETKSADTLLVRMAKILVREAALLLACKCCCQPRVRVTRARPPLRWVRAPAGVSAGRWQRPALMRRSFRGLVSPCACFFFRLSHPNR